MHHIRKRVNRCLDDIQGTQHCHLSVTALWEVRVADVVDLSDSVHQDSNAVKRWPPVRFKQLAARHIPWHFVLCLQAPRTAYKSDQILEKKTIATTNTTSVDP